MIKAVGGILSSRREPRYRGGMFDMSVTVADLLKLPSLRNARLVAGRGGLDRPVSSISVLEYADANALQSELFENNEFYGSEIVITLSLIHI